METELMEIEGGAVLKLKGRLDTKTSKDAADVFTEVGEKYDNVTLDLKDLSYISSAGIRAVRNLYMILFRKKGTLSVENPGENVLSVFKMTGLSNLFNLK